VLCLKKRVKSTHDEIMFEAKKRENMEVKEFFLHKSASKRLFWYGTHSLLRPADTRGSADIIYRI